MNSRRFIAVFLKRLSTNPTFNRFNFSPSKREFELFIYSYLVISPAETATKSCKFSTTKTANLKKIADDMLESAS